MTLSSLLPSTRLSQVLLILTLFAALQISPPSSEDPSENILPCGPKTVQAAGFPTIDIGQIFGHLSNFAQNLQTIANLRKKYALVRDNFKLLADITGWNALDDFFKPIDEFLKQNFDPVFQIARVGYGAFKTLRDEYYKFDSGGQINASSLQEQLKIAGNMTMNFLKDSFTEPAKTNAQLEGLKNKLQAVNDCMEEAARGSMTMHQCRGHLQSLGVRQMGMIEKAIATQTALIAARGLDDKAAEFQRRRLLTLLSHEARQATYARASDDPNYRDTPRLLY